MNSDLPIQQARLVIFEHFLAHANPPTAEQLMNELSLSRAETSEVLRQLQAARHIALVPGTARILMAFPFSAIATPFRVTLGERTYFANCAWDAIAFHAMLGDDVRVDPPETLVYLALRPTRWWDDIVTTCSNTMVFFASPQHRDASDLCAAREAAASLTPDQVHLLSEPIYARKFELDYARPSRQALLEHFAAMGLTGNYWTL